MLYYSEMSVIYKKQVSYMLAPSTIKLLADLRRATSRSNAELIAEGVASLSKQPTLVRDLPEQPYGSGKKSKVFNLPVDTVETIGELAEEYSCFRTHVVDVAIRLQKDTPPANADDSRGKGQYLLQLVRDEDLIAEIRRRGLALH